MPIHSESLNRKLYDLLSTRGYDPKPLDVEGKVTPVPEEAAVIKFDFIKDDENYGKVWASIDGSKTLQLYYGDSVSGSPDDPTKNVGYDDTWTGLLKHLKNWSQRRQLGFELKNENHLVSDMARRSHTAKKEKISEESLPKIHRSVETSNAKGVSEGSLPGQAAWKKEMLDKGAVKFWRDQHGGGTVDRIIAKDKDGNIVGAFNRKGVAEMDNRTPSGDRKEQRANSPEAIAQREKEQQANLKKVSPEMRKKLRLPDPDKEDMAEGSEYTPPKLGTVKANLMLSQKPTVQVKVFKHNTLRGDSYWVTKEVRTFKTMDQAQAYVDRINKQDVAEGQETMKQVSEGYYPMGKQGSYSDAVPTTKIIIQHSRKIEEGEQRYRNIAKIFVENTQGERFAVPTIKPGIARVYARHIAEGGTPYDERGKHITSLVEEYSKMAGFVRATKGKQFNESAQQLVNEGLNHYQSLRESLRRMTGHRGYTTYFESWTPTLVEDGEEQNNLNELFVQETLDPRIESVMPILSRLHKQAPEVNETLELAAWAAEVVNEKLEIKENTDIPLPVRSLYTQTYAKYAKTVGQAKGAKQMAYTQVEKKYGKEMADKLKAYHDQNSKLDEMDVAEGYWQDALKRVEADREARKGKPFEKNPASHDKKGVYKGDKDLAGNPVPKRKEQDVEEGSDISGLLAANHLNKSFIITAELAEGGTRRYRVKAQSERIAKEKFMKHHSMAKIIDVKEEGVSEDLDADQKRAGQLGPTEKVGPKGAVGKLVGT